MLKIVNYFLRVSSLSLYLLLTIFLCSCADLIIKEIKSEPLTTTTLVMKATVKNIGFKQASASTTSLKKKYHWSDSYILISTFPTPPLNRGEEIDLPIFIYSPGIVPPLPGMCMHLQACADENNDVEEGWFGNTNNCKVRSLMNNTFCRDCSLCCEESLPSVFDWTNWHGTNWVTPVRDQANCGSCWAFSVVAAVEAKNNVEKYAEQISPIDLSEQQLVSCQGGGGDCTGGYASTAMYYIQTNGVVGENTLSYTSTDCVTDSLTCKSQCSSATISGCANPLLTAAQCAALDDPATPGEMNPPSWRIGGYYRVYGSTVDNIKRALVCHGPLSACGTWEIDSAGKVWGHCVLIVGWNDHIFPSSIAPPSGWSEGAWHIKNSWGTGYYNNGYGYIPFSGYIFSDLINSVRYTQDITRRP